MNKLYILTFDICVQPVITFEDSECSNEKIFRERLSECYNKNFRERLTKNFKSITSQDCSSNVNLIKDLYRCRLLEHINGSEIWKVFCELTVQYLVKICQEFKKLHLNLLEDHYSVIKEEEAFGIFSYCKSICLFYSSENCILSSYLERFNLIKDGSERLFDHHSSKRRDIFLFFPSKFHGNGRSKEWKNLISNTLTNQLTMTLSQIHV